jgi:hypothetical protein
MRSDLVFGAMKHVSNRFLLVKVLASATRNFHRPGARIEDTVNDVLARCGRADPIACESTVPISSTNGSRRSRPRTAVGRRAGTATVLPVGKNSQAASEPSAALVA